MNDNRFATMFGEGGWEIDNVAAVGDAEMPIGEEETTGNGGACSRVVVVGEEPVVDAAEK
jgi:hypothetical protein